MFKLKMENFWRCFKIKFKVRKCLLIQVQKEFSLTFTKTFLKQQHQKKNNRSRSIHVCQIVNWEPIGPNLRWFKFTICHSEPAVGNQNQGRNFRSTPSPRAFVIFFYNVFGIIEEKTVPIVFFILHFFPQIIIKSKCFHIKRCYILVKTCWYSIWHPYLSFSIIKKLSLGQLETVNDDNLANGVVI